MWSMVNVLASGVEARKRVYEIEYEDKTASFTTRLKVPTCQNAATMPDRCCSKTGPKDMPSCEPNVLSG